MSKKGGILSGVSLMINLLVLIGGIFFFNINEARTAERLDFLTVESENLNNCELLLINILDQEYSKQSDEFDSLSSQYLLELYESILQETTFPYGAEQGFELKICEGDDDEFGKCLEHYKPSYFCKQQVYDIKGITQRGLLFVPVEDTTNSLEQCYFLVSESVPGYSTEYCNVLGELQTCYEEAITNPQARTRAECDEFYTPELEQTTGLS